MNKHGQILKEAKIKSEMSSWQSARTALLESKVAKWSEYDTCGPDLIKIYEKNPHKARSIAMYVENQEKYLQQLTETQVSTAYGPALRPEHLLKAVYIGAAKSKRGEIFSEFSLASTDDVLMYIYMNYQVTGSRGANIGDRVYEKQAPYVAGEQQPPLTIATGNGSSTNFTYPSLSMLPVIPFWVRIIVDGAVVAVDNGAGTLVNLQYGTALNTSLANTIDYTTGAIVLNFATAPANGAVIQVMWNWSSENSTNFSSLGQVGIELRKERFSARPMPLGYSYSMMTQIMLDSDNIGNAREMMLRAVGDAHAMAIDARAIQFARQVAKTNTGFTFNTDFASNGEISRKSWAQNILQEIGNVSATITNEIQRGEINRIVGGPLAVNYLRLHDLWKEDSADAGFSGTRKVGDLAGIQVFQCPATTADVIGNNELLLTYKNPIEGMDTSIVFGDLTMMSAELTYPQMYTEGYAASVSDQKAINPKFVRILTLQNLTSNIGA